jgi:hypothetical protein
MGRSAIGTAVLIVELTGHCHGQSIAIDLGVNANHDPAGYAKNNGLIASTTINFPQDRGQLSFFVNYLQCEFFRSVGSSSMSVDLKEISFGVLFGNYFLKNKNVNIMGMIGLETYAPIDIEVLRSINNEQILINASFDRINVGLRFRPEFNYRLTEQLDLRMIPHMAWRFRRPFNDLGGRITPFPMPRSRFSYGASLGVAWWFKSRRSQPDKKTSLN